MRGGGVFHINIDWQEFQGDVMSLAKIITSALCKEGFIGWCGELLAV